MKKIYITFLFFALIPIIVFSQGSNSFKLHSHNDYLRNVPFWEAFGAGCASIEVDLILQDNQLMVAHEKESIHPERTLINLYLEPIQKAETLGLTEGFDFHLLVDFKTEAYETLDLLIKQLKPYEPILYSANNPRGLKLIISGNRPKAEDYHRYPSWILFDYQSKSLNTTLPWDKIAMVSLNFNQFSVWNGKGRMVEAEKEKLLSFINEVHSFEKPVRFWASPDSKSAWKAFYEMGVDYINTDKPNEAKQYLSNLDRNIYSGQETHTPYSPDFENDGAEIQPEKIILMIGDGNGLAQLSAGMFANKNQLNMIQLKNMGFVKTQAADDFTTDSAAGGTAFATGGKANNRALGISPSGKSLTNITEILHRYGFSSGIVTTDRLTGATPAAFYAHHPERDDIDQIAAYLPESKLDLFVGGGKRDFTQFETNRLDELSAKGFTLMRSLDEIGGSEADKIGYFASPTGMPSMEKGRGEYLLKSTRNSIRFLENKKSPFFLMIESALIDSGGHGNSSSTIVRELLDFDQVIGWMIQYVDQNPNTLLIITADHETAGVSLPQGNILKNEVEFAFHSDDHTGIMVPIFAYGAHSGEFRGVYENTEVFHKIMKLVKKYYQE